MAYTSVNNDFINSLRVVAENKYSPDSPASEDSLAQIPLYRFPNGVNTAGRMVNGELMKPDMSGYLIVDKDTGDINGLQWGFKSYTGQAAISKIKELARKKATDGSDTLGFAEGYYGDARNTAVEPKSVIDVIRGERTVDVPNPNYRNYFQRVDDAASAPWKGGRTGSNPTTWAEVLLSPITALFTAKPKTVKEHRPVDAKAYTTDREKRENTLENRFHQETGWEHLFGA